jgi:hypothetical protein
MPVQYGLVCDGMFALNPNFRGCPEINREDTVLFAKTLFFAGVDKGFKL